MSLLIKKSKPVVRVRISQQRAASRQFTLVDTPIEEVLKDIKRILKPKVDCFGTGLVTSLQIFREESGKRTGEAEWLSFRGLTVDETFELLTKQNDDEPTPRNSLLRGQAQNLETNNSG